MNDQTFKILCRAFDPNCEFFKIYELGSNFLYAFSNPKVIQNIYGVSDDKLTEYIKSEINR